MTLETASSYTVCRVSNVPRTFRKNEKSRLTCLCGRERGGIHVTLSQLSTTRGNFKADHHY